MKQFTRIEPTVKQTFGLQYKRTALIKKFRTEDGVEHEFTTIGEEGGRAGAVIAITPDKQVIITYQFRPGPGQSGQWMYDLPGGGFNADEDEQVAALRELREETGYKPGKVEFLGESVRDAYINTMWYYFIATDCVPVEGSRELDKEEQEQGAEVCLISIAELIENAKHSRMTDPHAVLMAYDKLKEIEANG